MLKNLFPKVEFMIVPKEPVQETKEILAEVKSYFANENKEVIIIREDALPIVLIEEKNSFIQFMYNDIFVNCMWKRKK